MIEYVEVKETRGSNSLYFMSKFSRHLDYFHDTAAAEVPAADYYRGKHKELTFKYKEVA